MRKLWGALAALLVAGAAGGVQAQGGWVQGPPIPEGANEVIGATVGGQVLVYGGQAGDGRVMGIFWRFDPGAGAWTQLPSNPVAVHHGAAVGIGTKFYLFGGFRKPDSGENRWHPEALAWVYDAERQSWAALPPMPTPRGALSATALGGKIYVIGGAKIPAKLDQKDGLVGGGPVELVASNEVFDTETQTWSTASPMSLPRNHHGSVQVDGKLYVIGGRVGSCFSGGWSTNVWMNEEYDPKTDTWTPKAPMPTARSGIGMEVLDGRIHVLGGEAWIDNLGGVYRAHEVYDPRTNSWAIAPRMLTPRHGFATAQIGKRIFAVSGVNNAGGGGPLSVVAVNEIYSE
jgi:N-acetylneuraminic acid mutarotase